MKEQQLKQTISDILLDNFKFGEYGNGITHLQKLCRVSKGTLNKMIDAEYTGLKQACNVLETFGYELTIICKDNKNDEQVQSKKI